MGAPVRQSITMVTVSLDDVNDNKPQFSSSSYVSNVLLKEAEEGMLLLTLTATDLDAGDNSLVSYRSVQPRGEVVIDQLIGQNQRN